MFENTKVPSGLRGAPVVITLAPPTVLISMSRPRLIGLPAELTAEPEMVATRDVAICDVDLRRLLAHRHPDALRFGLCTAVPRKYVVP